MNSPTIAQLQLVCEIDNYCRDRGRLPTLLELATLIGITRAAVQFRMRWAEKKGLLDARHAPTQAGRIAIAAWPCLPADGSVPSGGTGPEI